MQRALRLALATAVGVFLAQRASAQEEPSPSPTPRPSPTATSPDWSSEPEPIPTPPPEATEEDELALLFSSTAKSSLGSKSETPVGVEDVAGDVTVISGDQIRAYGCRTLADVLALVPATFIGGDRVNDEAGIRGFALPQDPNDRVLVMLDGHSLVDAYQHYSAIDTGLPLDFDTIDRVEVIAGPASSIYGSNALFGVVNIVTKTPAHENDGRAAVSGGSFGYRRGEASWLAGSATSADTPWSIVIAATGRHVDGEVLHYDPLRNKGLATEKHSDYSDDASASLRARYGRVTLSAALFGRERGLIDNTPPLTPSTHDNLIGVRHLLADLAVSIYHSEDLALSGRVWADGVRIFDHLDYTPPPDSIYASISHEEGAELVGEWTAGPSNVVATAGGSLIDAKQTATAKQSNRIERATVQERYRLGTVGHVEVGAYGETSAEFSGRIAPRAGVVLHAWWGSTLKAVVARGFRDPSLFELGNTDAPIHAETIDDAEISAAQRFSLPIASRKIPVEVFGSLFYDDCYGFLKQRPDGFFINETEHIDAGGATIGARWTEGHDSLRGDFSNFDQHGRESRGWITGTPVWIAHVNGTHRFGDHLTFGVALSDVGIRTPRDRGPWLPSYLLVDASLAVVKIAHHADLRVTGTNLLDARYDEPLSSASVSPVVAGRSRSFFAELRAGF